MVIAEKQNALALAGSEPQEDLWQYVPPEVGALENPQTAIPRIAKDANVAKIIEAAVQRIPTVSRTRFTRWRTDRVFWANRTSPTQ